MDDKLTVAQRRAFYDALSKNLVPLVTEGKDYHDIREAYSYKVVKDGLINLGLKETTAQYHAREKAGPPRVRFEAAVRSLR